MHPLARLVAVVVLLGALGGLSVHYAIPDRDHSPYPEDGDLVTEYDAHVGEETLLFGTVQRVDADAERATIRTETDEGPLEMTVHGFTADVEPGGVVQVYGTLRANNVVDATEVAVVNPAGRSKAYKYAVSAVGAVLVLVVFFRHWRIDAESFAFEVRSDG